MSNVIKYTEFLVKSLLILVFITFMFSACRKKNTQTQNNADHPVPYTPVNITIYPGDPLNFKIQAIGGWMYLNGGINGIVLYRKSQQEFVALERTSSFLPNDPNAKIKVMADNFTCRDSVSNSRWQIIDGTVTQGPATWALKLYGTNFDGSILKISN